MRRESSVMFEFVYPNCWRVSERVIEKVCLLCSNNSGRPPQFESLRLQCGLNVNVGDASVFIIVFLVPMSRVSVSVSFVGRILLHLNLK